ncbi:MAG: PIG-L family deacetylase [Anaerolineales bacterium]|nr:PIG-L family deacetylase [Anaerolineales bacterium]
MSEYIPQRAMFICAHPDDLEFGVAGTAAKWAKNGTEVTYVLLTDGNAGSHQKGMTKAKLAEIRRAEQERAAAITGVQKCIFLGYDDGLLENSLHLRKELVRLIREYRPNVVACMDPTNFFPSDTYINHPDHRASGPAALDAVFPAAEMPLLYPDFDAEGLQPHKVNHVYLFFTNEANYYVDITDTIDLKIKALGEHKSQFDDWDPTERIKSWSQETGKIVGFKHAERFRRITLKEPEEMTEEDAPAADGEDIGQEMEAELMTES